MKRSNVMLLMVTTALVAGCGKSSLLVCRGSCEVEPSILQSAPISRSENEEYRKAQAGAAAGKDHIDVDANGKALRFKVDHDVSHLNVLQETMVRDQSGASPLGPVKTVLSPQAKEVIRERALNGVNR
jgi:hypothetical protein